MMRTIVRPLSLTLITLSHRLRYSAAFVEVVDLSRSISGAAKCKHKDLTKNADP